MSIIDRFLNAMKLNPDDEDDYDDYDDDEPLDVDTPDEEAEEKPKRHFFFGRSSREEEEEEEYSRPQPKEKLEKTERRSRFSASRSSSRNSDSNVLPMRQVRRQVKEKMQVCIIKPTSVEDAREITETLLDGKTIILNMEGLNLDVAQRIIDFTSGSCFAISGNLQKVSNFIFILTPPNVEISGDIQDLLGSAEGTSSVIQANM